MQIRNVRFIVAAITTFSAYAVYVSRVNLSMAIIAMVDDSHSHGHGAVNASSSVETTATAQQTLPAATNTTPFEQVHPPPMSTRNSFRLPMISQYKFDWNQTEQGHILGAFFYGYILFQVPGARVAESVGAKWIILAANAGSAFISLVFPLSTQLNSVPLLMALRFVMGLCQSAFFPAAYVLFCRWLPESERSILLPIMFIGSNVGSISTYTMSSYLIGAAHGWPSVFYLSGAICSLVTVLWCVFGSNGPSDNWLIGAAERHYIVSAINRQQAAGDTCGGGGGGERPQLRSCRKESVVLVEKGGGGGGKGDNNYDLLPLSAKAQHRLPAEPVAERARLRPSWRKLLTSVPVWTLIVSMYGNEWSQVVLCYELPTYLNTALNFPIEQNGVINSFFQLSYTVSSPIMSSLGAYMLDNRVMGMGKLQVRKLFQSLATFGQLACFVAVPVCGANRGLIILFMFSAIVFKSCANAGDIMVSSDLSPEYAGTIFAFANSCGNTAGFFVPELAGAFVSDARQREQWTPFWLTTAALMATSGLVFLAFGDTSRQDFVDRPAAEPPLKPANAQQVDINNNNNSSSSSKLSPADRERNKSARRC